MNRYDLLLLVKKLGKFAGFTPRMIQLLDYYMAFTRDIDWEEGSRPIVYQSLSRTALDLGVSERQIQKLEKTLADLGAVTWNDSGNHKRYGQRDPKTGRILYAFGIELTPLAAMKAELEDKLQDKKLLDAAWMETKRQISWYRSQIRSLIAESVEEGRDDSLVFQRKYDEIAIQLRTHLSLDFLRALLERHKNLHSEILSLMGVGTTDIKKTARRVRNRKETQKHSPSSEQKFVHYQSTNHQSSVKTDTSNPAGHGIQESVVETSEPNQSVSSSGIEHVKLSVALQAMGNRFREQLLSADPDWNDLHEAAFRVRRDLRISQQSWGDACQTLGRSGAAVCVLITDRAVERTEDPVRKPAAYLRAMVKRGRKGELRLHRSIFGLASTSEQMRLPASSPI